MIDVKANRAVWVAALRSGEYKKTTGVLFDGVGYCCLGVGCKVMGIEPQFDGGNQYLFGRAGNKALAPQEFSAAIGLKESIGKYDGGSLANDNDERGLTFNQIADIIESEPPGLFDAD